jgi:DNA-binding MarR family transcriptional regulator
VSFALNILELINSEDEDIKKIVADKTTLEIVLLIYRYEMNKINIKSADKFLEENQITASRSKKIAVIQKLVQNKIINREVNKDDKRSKMIYLNKSVKDKLDKILK